MSNDFNSTHKPDAVVTPEMLAAMNQSMIQQISFDKMLGQLMEIDDLKPHVIVGSHDTVTVNKKPMMSVKSTPNDGLDDARAREMMIHIRLRTMNILQGMSGAMIQMPQVSGLKDLHTSLDAPTGRVFIFLVNNGKPVVLEDDLGLFPSDALIAQLILLRDAA